MFDQDKTGKINFKNLKKIAAEVGENLSDEELQEMLDEAEKSKIKQGIVDFEDFYRVMKKNCDDPMGEFDSDDDEEGVYQVKGGKTMIMDPKMKDK